ncbi:hypothetical protein GOBAR_AA38768 [Gossypium barbadense]|uniref:Uncharacterized protein n=1 Tax=Gossypium barbadense TaxID=3634 RepID=A0A2P5QQG8_GOSBA|nr:hypothetical protein GOBAR_DD26296 [Gossypium barbadense]PPR81945.1 hypothetical protein GOBAR_AA38768 [Gossypium barbadense]
MDNIRQSLSLDQIKTQWPVLSDLQETEGKYKDDVLAEDEAKRRLLQVGEKFEKLDRLRSKSYFARPWMKPTREELFSKWIDLENQLHDEDNNKVEYKDFRVLEQALKTTLWGKTPDYLQPIAL